MKINPDKCVACGNCTYVCPMGAIYVDPAIQRATVNRDECVECYACFNGLSQEHLNPTLVRLMRKMFQLVRVRFEPEPDVCPTAAFEPEELVWPRIVRRAFSDPIIAALNISGRKQQPPVAARSLHHDVEVSRRIGIHIDTNSVARAERRIRVHFAKLP